MDEQFCISNYYGGDNGKKSARLGDLIAGTTLVETKSHTALHQTLYTPVAETNYALIIQVINLNPIGIYGL